MRARVLAEAARTRQAAPRPDASRRVRAGRLPPRPLTVAAAACLVLALALAAVLAAVADRTGDRADRLQARQDRVERVLAAPDARAVSGPVRAGGQGTVVMSERLDEAVVILAGLPSAPPGRTCELWLLGDGAPRPAGLLAGAAGSRAPTTPPVFAAPLPG